MKTKGIPIWERGIERIVLGIAGLVFVAFTAMQFIGDPNAVEKGGQKISPGQVDDILRTAAESVAAGLDPSAPSALQLPETEPLAAQFGRGVTASISPVDRLPVVTRGEHPGGPMVVARGNRYVEPVVGAPIDLVAKQYIDMIQSSEVDTTPELQEVFESSSRDISWVTIGARFDRSAITESMNRSQGEASPIPLQWYDGKVTIIDMRLEREQLIDGVWSDRKLLDPLPARYSARSYLGDKVDAALRNQILEEVADPVAGVDIYQPPFYQTVQESWSPPDPDEEALIIEDLDPEVIERARLSKELAHMESKIQQVAFEIEAAGCPKDRTPPSGGGGESGGRKPPGPGGGSGGDNEDGTRKPPGPGGGGMGQGGAPSRTGGRAQEIKCKNLREKLVKFERRADQARRKLQSLGVDPSQITAADSTEGLVWGHDIGVQDGAQYRYRFTIEIYNPFFAHKLALVDEQASLADPFTVSSVTSEWSAPIRIEPPLQYFVTKAVGPGQRQSRGSGPDLGQVTAEVFCFHEGRWWKENFTVVPGQRIGATKDVARRGEPERMIDFGTEMFVLDIVPVPDRNARTGRAAVVKLQNAQTGEITTFIDPERQTVTPDRLDLETKVELADADLGSPASDDAAE